MEEISENNNLLFWPWDFNGAFFINSLERCLEIPRLVNLFVSSFSYFIKPIVIEIFSLLI